ncbi:MAG: DMT family transporter, partial [Trebonia sp.]
VTTARWGAGAGTVPAAPGFWLIAALVGVAGFGASFLLFNMMIVQVDAGRAAIVLNLIPVFGVVSAVVFLREGATSRDALGAVLIGSSVLYFAITDRREASAEAPKASQDAGLGTKVPLAFSLAAAAQFQPSDEHCRSRYALTDGDRGRQADHPISRHHRAPPTAKDLVRAITPPCPIGRPWSSDTYPSL